VDEEDAAGAAVDPKTLLLVFEDPKALPPKRLGFARNIQ